MKKLLFTTLLIPIFSFSNTPQREISLEEIFTASNTHHQEITELNKRCKELDLALEFQHSPETGELETILNVRGLKLPIAQKLLEKIYYKLVQKHAYYDMTSHVRIVDESDDLAQEELDFIEKRNEQCLKQLEKLLGISLEQEHSPRIALCLSGGGYRAMIASSGFMNGLEKTGLLDAAHYITSLSGSTWCIAPWMLQPEQFTTFAPTLIERALNNLLAETTEHVGAFQDFLQPLGEYFIRKLIFKELPTVVDLYGYCLAAALLDDNAIMTDITTQIEYVKDAKRPLPIYTAAIPPDKTVKEYAWVEFSPYEVSSLDLQGAVESWGFGRKFKNGASKTSAPPLPLGFLMGLWGSAMTISFEEVYTMILDKLEPKIIFAPLKQLAHDTFIGDLRIFPAQLRNYNYRLKNQPYNTQKQHTLIDAGLHFNLPLPPLLNPHRAVDIIIICDASGDILGAPELKLAEDYAHKKGYPFPVIDYTNISENSCTIFDDGPNSPAPVIIYLPMIKNDDYDPFFDPQDHLGLGKFMNTFNFNYTEKQALQLAGLFEHAMAQAKDSIIKKIKELVERKNRLS